MLRNGQLSVQWIDVDMRGHASRQPFRYPADFPFARQEHEDGPRFARKRVEDGADDLILQRHRRVAGDVACLDRKCAALRAHDRSIVEEARRTGYTETILGRRRYLPDLTSDNRQRREMAERMALNAPIQGSAADLIKVAMLRVDAAIRERGMASRMLLQVHDELVFEVASGERDTLETLVRESMGGAADLTVPLDVSVGTGRSWYEAAH